MWFTVTVHREVGQDGHYKTVPPCWCQVL